MGRLNEVLPTPLSLRGVLFLGVLGIASVSACGPQVVGESTGSAAPAKASAPAPAALAPVTLKAPAKDAPGSLAARRLTVEDEEVLGETIRTRVVEIELDHSVYLVTGYRSDFALKDTYTAYVQDGKSKHGERTFSDPRMAGASDERPFCIVTYTPFDTEEQKEALRWKAETSVRQYRLDQWDVTRTLPRKTRLLMEADVGSVMDDVKRGLKTIHLHSLNDKSPVSKMVCVGRDLTIGEVKQVFRTRAVYGRK